VISLSPIASGIDADQLAVPVAVRFPRRRVRHVTAVSAGSTAVPSRSVGDPFVA